MVIVGTATTVPVFTVEGGHPLVSGTGHSAPLVTHTTVLAGPDKTSASVQHAPRRDIRKPGQCLAR